MSQLIPADSPNDEGQEPPHASDSAERSGRGTDRRGRRDRSKIPDVEACLRAITELAGLVALRMITPREAQAIRQCFEAILKAHQHTQTPHSAQLSDDDVLRMYRNQPEVLHMLEPLLTDEQVELVARETNDNESSET